MSTVTKSLSGDFGNDLNISKFIYEILGSSIVTSLIGIELDGDDVNITFTSSLSGGETTTLNALIAAHTSTELTDNLGDRTSTLVSTSNPAVSNDITQNYEPGSFWINQSTDSAFICINGPTGAANWQEITPTPAAITTVIATSTAATATTSGTYVLLAGMTLTPPAHTYLCIFSSSGDGSANAADMDYALHIDATIITHTERNLNYGGGNAFNLARTALYTIAVVALNGSQAINVRYRTNGGTFSVYNRSLHLVELD